MNTTKPILVLSYNICFQAMCNDGTGSAPTLGDNCVWVVENELTICAQNMANFMDGAPASVGLSNFDFVGLQEANKAKYLQAEAKASLSKLKMIKSKSHAKNHGHTMHMASFYDASKYTLIEYKCSQFNSWNTDRPFHILLLKDNSTAEHILFINVHAPHGGSENTNHKGVYYSSFDAVSYDLSDAVQTMTNFDSNANYKIIMTGDFNETGWNAYAQHQDINKLKWQPLVHAGVTTDVAIANVVYSCSKPDGCWYTENGHRGGDYVFSSGQKAKIEVPSNYVFAPYGTCNDVSKMKSIWQSDHLPVMSKLT